MTRGAEGLRRASEAPLRWLTLEIPPPAHTRARFGPLTVIHAGEVDGSQPVSWTLPVTSLHQAREVVRRVEVADRGLGSSSARWRRSRTGIERAVAINAVTAWRIAALLARTEPELPSTTAFTDLALLKDFAHVRKLPPPEDLGQAFRLVATMGGYLNRSKDGPRGDHLERSGCAVVHGVDAWPQCRYRGRQRRAATHQLARRHLWVMGRAGQIPDLAVSPVTDRAGKHTWATMMARENPLGPVRAAGSQIRYVLTSGEGVLGGFLCAAPTRVQAARDRWIGWTPAQCAAGRHRIVGLARFLIRPALGRCRNLASRAPVPAPGG